MTPTDSTSTASISQGSNGSASTDAKTKKAKPPAPERLRDLVVDLSTVLIWDGEHAYAIVGTKGHIRTLPVGSTAFRRWLISAAKAQGIHTPTRETIKTTELAIEAVAEEAVGVQPTPSIRIAGRNIEPDPATIYIDLGDDDWKCAKVTAEGWETVPHPADGPFMYRPPRMAALPEPERGGSVEEIWSFINAATGDERLLVLAAMIAMLWPRGPYPVLIIFGEQGSTKTTAEEVIKSLVDPSRPSPDKHALTSLRRPPRDVRDVVAAARGARVIGFDNVSYLDEWLSDTICALSTGADMGGRELFSDFDEAIISVIRPVMINGIPEIVGKADLADRAIKLEARPPATRMEETKFWQDFREARPRILGALLDLLSATLARYPEAAVSEGVDVRMADFGHLGEAMALALGRRPGDFTRAYHDNRANAAREIAESDSMTPRLEKLVAEAGGEWCGTVGELLDALKAEHTHSGKGWWSSAQALRTHLSRQSAPLRAVGFKITKSATRISSPISGKKGKLYTITRAVGETS